MFIVHGGVFTDTSFITVTPGTEESYGPFPTHEEALQVWRGRMGRMVDTCEHRLFIKPFANDKRQNCVLKGTEL